MRWFHQQLGDTTEVEIRNITDDWMGFSVSGPASREIVAKLARDDLTNEAFPFLSVRPMEVGGAQAVVGRISLTGELGYEVVVPTSQHRALWSELREAGGAAGLRPIGDRAVDSLRLEKGYGIWSAEFRQENTPAESGLDRYVAFDKGDFGGWAGDRLVGLATSGAFGHHVGKSLALAYVDRDTMEEELTIYVVGRARRATIMAEIPYDPAGVKLRA
jgi:dimethylglycine dehydrogenase